MLQSKLFYKTTKNKSADVESISHDLLTRAGYIDQLMAGVYSFLPLGFKVLKNIEAIIRKNMEAIDGQELLLPSLHPKENWQKTGRWDTLDVLFKLKGANEKEYALARETLLKTLTELISDPEKLSKIKNKLSSFAKPNAAGHIANLILKVW